MEKKKMKARNDRLDIRSSRRLPFTILAQANFLFADMNPIKIPFCRVRGSSDLSDEKVVRVVMEGGCAVKAPRGDASAETASASWPAFPCQENSRWKKQARYGDIRQRSASWRTTGRAY